MNGLNESLHQFMHLARILVREWRGTKLEPEVPFMDRFLASDAQCLHIGASDGRHALYIARRAREGVVHCIEASSYTLEVLDRLRRLLGISNIRLYNLAIGATDGEVNLVTPIKTNGHRGRAFAFISEQPILRAGNDWDKSFAEFENQPVPRRSLDTFCAEQGISRLDFLRCDIEGAEILMLDGGTATIARERPVIMMEVHPIFLAERFGSSADVVWQRMTDLGYFVYAVRDGTLNRTGAFFDEPWRDYFFVPRERLVAYGL